MSFSRIPFSPMAMKLGHYVDPCPMSTFHGSVIQGAIAPHTLSSQLCDYLAEVASRAALLHLCHHKHSWCQMIRRN